MERIIRGRSATLYKTFYTDGVATDPTGAPTVTVARSDGTPITTATVTDEAAAGTWSVTIPSTSNTLLDVLTVTWTATIAGYAQTYVEMVEVAGGFHFGIADLRRMDPLQNDTRYPTDRLVEARMFAETFMEDACGVAFVPRYRIISTYGTSLDGALPPRTRTVRTFTVAGTAATYSTYRAATCYPAELTAGVEHGYDECPPWVARASMLVAKRVLVDSPVDDRFTSMSTEDGTFTMVTPGMRGAMSAIPEVNAAIEMARMVTV